MARKSRMGSMEAAISSVTMGPWEETSAPARKQPSSMETSSSSVTWERQDWALHETPQCTRVTPIPRIPRDPAEPPQENTEAAQRERGPGASAGLRGWHVEAAISWINLTGGKNYLKIFETNIHTDCTEIFEWEYFSIVLNICDMFSLPWIRIAWW